MLKGLYDTNIKLYAHLNRHCDELIRIVTRPVSAVESDPSNASPITI